MANPTNVYGDTSIPGRVIAGRPQVLLCIGDSIPADWFPQMYRQMPGLVGMDDSFLGLLSSTGSGYSTLPSSPGTTVAHSEFYEPRQTTGQGTLNTTANAGSSSLSVNYVSGGYACAGMKVIVGAETIDIDRSGGYAMAKPPTNPVTIPLAANTAAQHLAGVTVTWKRPSGEAAYCMNANTEIVFAASPVPTPTAWYNIRLCQGFETPTTGGAGGVDEATQFHDGGTFGPNANIVWLLFLAGPWALNASCLRLWGLPASTGYPSPIGMTSVDFNPYAVTPTLKMVQLSVPAPTGYSTANRGVFASVTPSGTGTYLGGEVFVPLMMGIQKTGATGGYILMQGCNAGFQLQHYAGSGPAGDIMSAAYWIQYVNALASEISPIGGLDTVMVQLGINNWDNATGLADMRTIRSRFTQPSTQGKTIALDYYKIATALTECGQISTAIQSQAADGGVVALDLYADAGDVNYVNTHLGDGKHPTTTAQTEFWTAKVLDLMNRAQAHTAGGGGRGKGASTRHLAQVF